MVSLLANSIFKKKWFKGYNRVFTKESFRFYNLKILVSKLAKAFHGVASNRFFSLLKHWNSLDANKALVIQVFVDSGANSGCIRSALFGVRKSYYTSKLAESLCAKESGIRSAIKRWMESFAVDKGHTIHSVLEHSFWKVVLDHLVFDVPYNISDSWQRQYLPLEYVDNEAFSRVMDTVSYENLVHMVKNLPEGKAAGLFGITNELWKHCNNSVLGMLLDLLNLCLVHKSVPQCWKKAWVSMIPKPYDVFDVLHGNNFSVLKGTITQSPIFAIGSVVEDALEKNHEL
ncbi:hypothetical protein G9A89_019490 [Geosiphon pyriformis]|nr:hypothetical protein G9A89_019490 [Geosiphon pyriformis]